MSGLATAAGTGDDRRGRSRFRSLGVALGLALVMSTPAFVAAQSTVTVDAYLHGSGGTANPPTLTLNTTAPTSTTAKYKDSSGINFNGGNAWQVVGTWPTSPVLAAGTLTGLTPVRVWLGLKNSDDQGTNFDLLAEVYKNGNLVTSGLTRCITGVTRNPASAAEALVAVGSFTAATLNGTSDTLSVKLSTRIGTNPDNTKCAGHNNAVGLRVYFDATTRAARVGLTLAPPDPTPSALTPNPLTLTVGASGTLTATLTPAPIAAGSLTVSSANTAIATVPASVPFAANQTSIPIPVTGVGVGTAQISVALNGGTVMSTVDVNPSALSVTSLTPSALSITQGGTGTLTVTINAVQSTNTVVSLSSSAASIAAVPAMVTVPAGQTTAPVSVSANTVGQADITASLNGSTATSHVTVTPVPPTVVSLLPPATHVTLGASGTLTVTISAAQAAATAVTLTATPANLITLPSTVIVPANQTSATVPVTGAAIGTALITASLNGATATAAVDVVPPGVQLTALQPPTQQLVVDAIGTLTVQLHAQQAGPTVVTVSVDPPTRLHVPPTVTVPPNQPQANFTVTALTAGTATITATLGSVSKTATVVVVPPPPSVVSLLPSPLPVVTGATGTLMLTINAAQPTDTVVPLTNSAPSLLDVPPSVTIPAGRTTVGLPAAALAVGTATVTATLNGTALATVQIVPPPVTLMALGPVPPAPAPLSVAKGRIGVLRVTVNRVPLDPTIVSLSNAQPNLVTVPSAVTVPAGALFADFPVTTQNQGTATISASLNSTSVTAQVVVTAPEVDALAVSPSAPTVFTTEPVSFTATATMTDGTTSVMTEAVTWTSSNTAVATIDNTGVVTTLTAGTTTITAATTNSLGPVSGETLLTVQPAPALTLTPTLATLVVGQATTLTITSAAPAGPAGLLVTLTQAGTGAVTVVGSATIPPTQSSVQVVVSGAAPGLVTVTGTAIGRTPGTTQFTVNLPPPTITSFTPTSGTIGTVVTITGTNLNGTGPGTTTVKFNNTNAIITSVSATSLTTTVPQGATDGPITVTTPGGTATGQAFSVQIRDNFTLTAAPSVPVAATVAQGGQTSYALTVTAPPSSTFTGLVALTLNPLPAGVTGQFSVSSLTVGQTGYLTIRTTGAVPAGAVPISVIGTATVEGGTHTQTIPLALQVMAAGGQTVLSGEVFRTDGIPIPNVLMKIIGTSLEARTNEAGQFLFPMVPSGTQQLMVNANEAVAGYPIYHTDLVLTAGQVSVLPTIWITSPPPPERFTTLNNATAAQIITDPRFPGAEITIPAGVTIMGWDGALRTKIALERLSPDKLPVPPPPGPTKSVFQIFFGTPMGGQPSAPIPVTLPNDLDLDPGEQAELWYYDASPLGGPGTWKLAGMGTVSLDGKKIISDPGVGIERFCGVCGLPCFVNRQVKQPNVNPKGKKGADPVDLATGIFTVEKTDLVLPGRLPLELSRTFNPFDPLGGIAGVQSSLGSGWYLSTDVVLLPGISFFFQTPDVMRLILPGNTRLDLSRVSTNTFVNTTHPLLKGAVLTALSALESELRFKDGSIWRFMRIVSSSNVALDFLVERTDRNGNRVVYERNIVGQVTRIIDSAGRQTTFTYTGALLTEIRDPIDRTVRYTYTNGRLATVTDLSGGVTQYTYDAAGRILSIQDARGIAYIANEYGAGSGRILRQTQADGGVWKFRYKVTGATVSGPNCPEPAPPGTALVPRFPLLCPTEESIEAVQAGYSFVGGRVIATTLVDPRGQATVHRFNGAGFEAEMIDALGQSTTSTYDGSNQITAVTDALGRTTRLTYDSVGNVTTITDPNSQVTRFEYESTFNRVTKITDALNQVTEFTYDQTNGNLLTVKDPLNQTTTMTYDGFGQPLTVTDPLNQTTTFTYDQVVGNLIATADPLGNMTQHEYDQVSRLLAVTDPRGFATSFTYDALNRITQVTDAMNGLTGLTYDPNGNLLTVTDAEQHTTTYTYDNMDRLATRRDPLNRTERYLYDPAGNLTQFTDRKNQVATFQYDTLNRRIQATYPDAVTAFTYDSVGRLVKVSDTAPGAGAIDFTYDMLDRLVQETTPQGTVAYQYDVLGRRTQMTANGQQPTMYQYDAVSRLTRVERGALFAALGYDNADRRTSLGYSNGTTASYAYDLASRLTNITHNGPGGTTLEALTYTYDAAGNRTALMRNNNTASLLPNAVASASYDAANEQTAFAGQLLEYDANGNLWREKDGTGAVLREYAWDARNRLVGISGNATASFNYDALGRRTSKTINSVTTQFAYDSLDIVAEIGGGAVGAHYLSSLNIDEPFVRQSGTGTEHYHVDALGSSLVLSNAQGNSGTIYAYEPFGKTMVTGTSANSLHYTGRENDGNNLYYYRERSYSPAFHRFLSEDTLRMHGSSLYNYVLNSPLNYVDPLGLEANEGFQNQVSQMKDSSLNKTIRSHERNIAEHEIKLNDPTQHRAIKHHEHELRVFREQLRIALKEAVRRGLRASAILALLLNPGVANAGELEELKRRCPQCFPPRTSKSAQ